MSRRDDETKSTTQFLRRGLALGDGFGLYVVSAEQLDTRVTLLESLGQDPALALAVVDVATLDDGAIDRPIEDGQRRIARSDRRRVVVVTGLEELAERVPEVMARLNEHRNELRARVDAAVVLLGTPLLQDLVQHQAPDVWSARAADLELVEHEPSWRPPPLFPRAGSGATMELSRWQHELDRLPRGERRGRLALRIAEVLEREGVQEARAHALYEQATQELEDLGSRALALVHAANLADPERAEEAVVAAAATMRELEEDVVEPGLAARGWLGLARLWRGRGRPDEAQEAAGHALRLADRSDTVEVKAAILADHAERLAIRGGLSEALGVWEKVLSLPLPSLARLEVLVRAGATAALAGRRDRLARYWREYLASGGRPQQLDAELDALGGSAASLARKVLAPPKRGPSTDSEPVGIARIYVSSTHLGDALRRSVVEDAVRRAGAIPVGMKRFTASTQPTLEERRRQLAQCDALLLVMAHRYGWVPAGEEHSVLEIEYDEACRREIGRLVLLESSTRVDSAHDFDHGHDRWKKQTQLEAFKVRLATEETIVPFTDDMLGDSVFRAVEQWLGSEDGRIAIAQRLLEDDATPRSFSESLSEYQRRLASLHDAGLNELYVETDVVSLASVGRGRDALLAGDIDRPATVLKSSEVLAACQGERRGLILLGDPGSGKTTLLRHLLHRVLDAAGPHTAGLPDGTIPVFLSLRNLDERARDWEDFVQSELMATQLGLDEGFVRELLASHRPILYLVDGLDEIAEEELRARVSAWIERVLETDSTARALVTCRYAGYTRDVRLSGSFAELHLRPFTVPQVERFVHNRFRSVEAGLAADHEHAEARAEQQARTLIEILRDPDFTTPRLAGLSRNPVLLTAICLVHRDRGRLPARRAELYGQIIAVLLERWREAKALPVGLPVPDALHVLQSVALWLHEHEGRRQAAVSELAPVVGAALQETSQPTISANRFLRSICDQSSVLTEWGPSRCGFMHLGFQEYLAARELRNREILEPGPFRAMARRFDDPWWQEVILLMLAQGDPPLFDRFMREVVQRPEFPQWAQSRMMDLCLHEALGTSEQPFVDVLTRTLAPGQEDHALAALRVLARSMPEALERLDDLLTDHPADPVRQWWRSRKEQWPRRCEFIVAPRGGVELVRIPAGRFMMGSPDDEPGHRPSEGPRHEVELSSFYLGRYPVTNAQYGEFLRDNPEVEPPRFWGDRRYNRPQQPVVGVSWDDARSYCEWAGLSLPTEAQWEHACRAGTITRYWSGDGEEDLARVAWYGEDPATGQTHPVGEKPPNPFGLHDMHGNVFEWCEDTWSDGFEGAEHRPGDGLRVHPEGTRFRIIRGGSWIMPALGARSAYRYGRLPHYRSVGQGFRPATADGALARLPGHRPRD